MRALIDFTRGVGYREPALWTNDVLGSAGALRRRHRFDPAGEEPHRSFVGADLIGQDRRLTLRKGPE